MSLNETQQNFFCIVEKVWETATVHLAIADPTDTDIPNTGAELQHSVTSDMLYKNNFQLVLSKYPVDMRINVRL